MVNGIVSLISLSHISSASLFFVLTCFLEHGGRLVRMEAKKTSLKRPRIVCELVSLDNRQNGTDTFWEDIVLQEKRKCPHRSILG